MAETEEEERYTEHNANHVTMDTISTFQHCTISPSQGEIANVTTVHSTISLLQGEIVNMTSVCSTVSPSQGKIASVTSERRIS